VTIDLLIKGLSRSETVVLETLPYLEYFNRIAFAERDNFIRYISAMGKKTPDGNVDLREYFKSPHFPFSVWHLSLTVEKDPLKNTSYHNLVKLLTIIRFQKETGSRTLVTDLDSSQLSRAISRNKSKLGYECKDLRRHRNNPKAALLLLHFLKAIKHYLYLIYKIFVIWLNMGRFHSRKKILKNAQYALFTYFPLIDKTALGKGKFINKYFDYFQSLVERKYENKFAWFAIASHIDGFSFFKSARLAGKINGWNKHIYFVEEWVALKDLITVWVHYFYFAMKFILKHDSFSRSLEYSDHNIDIWDLFEDEWISSFAGGVLISGLIFSRIFSNISKALNGSATVMYLAENKAWERVLNFFFHYEKKFKTVAVLHSSLPLLLLSFFDHKDDLIESKDARLAIPEPDYVACNGKIPLKLLRKSGWDGKRAFLWFALRYQHLKGYLQEEIAWTSRQNKILVVLSTVLKESQEMLLFIHQAFGSSKRNCQIIIKEHYNLPINSYLRQLKMNFCKDQFVFSNGDLDEILRTVKAVVLTGSSVGLESIALGCPVIVPRFTSVVDMNPLSGISDLPIYVDTPSGLRDTVEGIMAKKKSPLPRDKCRGLIEDYFEFYNSENELMEKIESLP